MNFLERWIVEQLLSQADETVDYFVEGQLIDEFQTPDGLWHYTARIGEAHPHVICRNQLQAPTGNSKDFLLYIFSADIVLETPVVLASRKKAKTNREVAISTELVENGAALVSLFLPSRKRKNV